MKHRKALVLFFGGWVLLIIGAVALFLRAPAANKSQDAKSRKVAQRPDDKAAPTQTQLAPKQTLNKIKFSSSNRTTLSDEERQFLWDVEHHGNSLAAYGFSEFARAVSEGDGKLFARILSDDFVGQLTDPGKGAVIDAQFVKVERRDRGKDEVDAKGFVAHMRKLQSLFSKKPQVKLNLMMLCPEDRKDLDSIWAGTCRIRMWAELAPGKPGEVMMYLRYRIRRPTKENLQSGKWLKRCEITYSQVSRSDRYLMKEVAAKRGIKTKFLPDHWVDGAQQEDKEDVPENMAEYAAGCYVTDYNRDGYLDMLVTGRTYRLYRGIAGGKFKNATAEVKLAQQVQDANAPVGFADLNGDGWEDLIFGNLVFENVEGKQFKNVTDQCNLVIPNGATNVTFADYDCDGRIDMYVTAIGAGNGSSWITGQSANLSTNELWRNKGNWLFENVTDATGTGAGARSTFSAVWLDANNDNLPDIYVINEFGNGVLLVNSRQGKFTEHAVVNQPSEFGTMGVTCGDVDNNGFIDIYEASMYSKAGSRVITNLADGTYQEDVMRVLRAYTTGSQLHLNLGKGKYQQVGPKMRIADIGWSYGAALADLDNDGWLDLHATCGHFSRTRAKPDG